jgi:hypothetical protein
METTVLLNHDQISERDGAHNPIVSLRVIVHDFEPSPSSRGSGGPLLLNNNSEAAGVRDHPVAPSATRLSHLRSSSGWVMEIGSRTATALDGQHPMARSLHVICHPPKRIANF